MRRILFVKTSSLGDVVHHFPAVSDAARRLPGAAIDWVVEEAFADLARMHPAVSRVVPVALRRWRRALWRPETWSEIGAFRRALRAESYEAVIDTQSLLKSAVIASAAPGIRHGMDRASAREPLAASFYDVVHAVSKDLHAVERNRRLTGAALAYVPEGAPDYGVDALLADAADDYAVFLTMTSRADKLWPEARWIEIGRALSTKIVLPWGSEAEKARAERIAAALPSASVPAKMAIPELARLFSRARAVVGVDTGLTHLAAALGVRTVGVYGGSDPARTGLYAKAARNLGGIGEIPDAAQVREALAAIPLTGVAA